MSEKQILNALTRPRSANNKKMKKRGVKKYGKLEGNVWKRLLPKK